MLLFEMYQNSHARRFRRRTVVVDVGGEVAGVGPVPHACIGKARRLPVRDRAGQAAASMEAMQNHAPQVGTQWHVLMSDS